ncbi:MAG: type II toxin-antitoxin system VapC family toxin [Bifidobacteriaceae bacterium]|jgi:predicted nucleic acid-binding protein|nr:type II toxin-antitoxin system VapC family toxin [Bifidobacteriaceae bacterium]
MRVFADTSAVVKLYADEPGFDQIRDIAAMYLCELSRVEVPAALWRKNRIGELAATSVGVLVQAFENEYISAAGRFAVVRLTGEILDRAAGLAAIHGLRAYDAIQLATALTVRHIDNELDTFACFDQQLSDAAIREGLQVFP